MNPRSSDECTCIPTAADTVVPDTDLPVFSSQAGLATFRRVIA